MNMTYYPDEKRMELVVSYLHACDSKGTQIYQREIHTALGMNKNAVWKVLQVLVEDGRVERIQTDEGPAGHKRLIIILTEWERLTEDQRERIVAALERIAESQERMADAQELMAGMEIPGKRMPRMETKQMYDSRHIEDGFVSFSESASDDSEKDDITDNGMSE